MKKMLVVITLFAACALFLAAETKIGLINPQLILQNSVKGKQVIEKLQKWNKEKSQRFDVMQKEIDALQKDAANPALSTAVREKKAAELRVKQTDIKRFAEDAQREFQQQQQNVFEAMQRELGPIVSQIAKTDGYSLVLNVNEAAVAFAAESLDITPLVIKAYDAKYAKPIPPAVAGK